MSLRAAVTIRFISAPSEKQGECAVRAAGGRGCVRQSVDLFILFSGLRFLSTPGSTPRYAGIGRKWRCWCGGGGGRGSALVRLGCFVGGGDHPENLFAVLQRAVCSVQQR